MTVPCSAGIEDAAQSPGDPVRIHDMRRVRRIERLQDIAAGLRGNALIAGTTFPRFAKNPGYAGTAGREAPAISRI